MRRVLVLAGLAFLLVPVAAADPGSQSGEGAGEDAGEGTSECSAPDFTVRDLVVYTCQGGRWEPLGCLPFCDPSVLVRVDDGA